MRLDRAVQSGRILPIGAGRGAYFFKKFSLPRAFLCV